MILVRACLLGCACRYDGQSKPNPLAQELARRGLAVPVCPEQLGGLPTPRNPSERRGDRVVMNDGRDVTAEYHRGAEEPLRLGRLYGCTAAVLKERSPSCGCGRIYDGTFTGTLTDGDGVTAALLKDRHHVDPLSACQTETTPDELEKLIADVADILVADRIYDYIAELVDVTRSNAYVTLGVSPRGALAVTRAAKANAYLEGRNYVIPDDVCAVFPDVCVHRLILNAKARLQEYTAAQILQNILTSVQKPDIREFSDK